MKLPEPIRQAWRKHRGTLKRIAGYEPGGRVLLGGGTILSARWGHRLSEDIDILLPDREAIRDIQPGKRNDLAKATGGRVEGRTWRDRIKVRVEGGVLDICAAEPQLQGLERTTEVEGEPATVLSSAQILRGKLNRSQQGLARDAFDLVTAVKAEARALEHAVNALDANETDIVRTNLEDANDFIAEAAPDALKGIGTGFETDTNRLGWDAARSIDESQYRRVRLTLEPSRVKLERWTIKGQRPTETWSSEAVAEGVIESGIGEYLKANHDVHESMVSHAIAQLQREGRTGTIFDTDEGTAPTREIEEAAARALGHHGQTWGDGENGPDKNNTTQQLMRELADAPLEPDGGEESRKADERHATRDTQARRIRKAMETTKRPRKTPPKLPGE